MNYNCDFLKTFDGCMKPSQVDMAQLINVIETNVSQYKYYYKTSLKDYPEITIEVTNANIPHLLGLSKNHHYGLPNYNAGVIFEGLKDDWTLDNLKKGDEVWFAENQDKIIGVLLLYQIFHVQECKIYSTKHIFNQPLGSKFKRDKICFIVLKLANGKYYSIELTPINNSENSYIPRSLKINDTGFTNCEEIDMQLVSQQRIRTKKSKMKRVKWKLGQ